MPWVRFTANYDWKKTPRVVTAYKAGMVQLVSQACRDAAVAASAAVEIERPDGAPAVTALPEIDFLDASPPRIRRRANAGG
jgi:hypothetical protein